jgi:hypothetical protein
LNTFFRGWRRKIGVLTLLITCVLTGGWLRSLSTQDTFTVGFGSSIQYKLISIAGQLIIANVSIDGERPIRTISWTSQKISEHGWEMVLQLRDSSQLRWINAISSDLFSTGNDEMGANFISFVVKWCQFPYWMVVTPLTALSAFLLLTKPCKLTQTKFTEPTAAEGT